MNDVDVSFSRPERVTFRFCATNRTTRRRFTRWTGPRDRFVSSRVETIAKLERIFPYGENRASTISCISSFGQAILVSPHLWQSSSTIIRTTIRVPSREILRGRNIPRVDNQDPPDKCTRNFEAPVIGNGLVEILKSARKKEGTSCPMILDRRV